VSTKSGHIFERRLIEKSVESTGKCPVTDAELSLDDLIPVQAVNKAVRPRPPQATSLANLLKTFQGEWDSLMLETYTLRQHLDTARQELSHALYQHDAACRVIARLIQERDQARQALADTRANMSAAASGNNASAMEVDSAPGIDEQCQQAMHATAKKLSKQRKKKFKAGDFSGFASSEQIGTFGVSQSSPLHLTTDPGIVCVDVHPTKSELVLTGGQDGNVIVFNKDSKKQLSTNKGHEQKITSVQFHPSEDIVLSSSADGTAKVWNKSSDKYDVASSVSCHSSSVVGVSLHATGDFFATASADKTWAFHDIATGKLRTHVSDSKISSAYTGVQFHPDGLILATGGADSTVRIWDVINQSNVASFDGHQEGGVSAMAFSENGYYLASADNHGVVKLWDLRKLQAIQTLNVGSQPVHDLHFDGSGQHLAVAGEGVTVYHTKSWDVVKKFEDHSKAVTGVRFGQNAQFVASVSLDRNLNIYQQ